MTVLDNTTAALGQAQACVGDDAAMGSLRVATAAAVPPGIALLSMDDAAVAEVAAAAMASGTLHLGPPVAPPPLFRIAVTPAAPLVPTPWTAPRCGVSRPWLRWTTSARRRFLRIRQDLLKPQRSPPGDTSL